MPRKGKQSNSKLHHIKGYTLFARNLPTKKTTSQVHLHFSKYGKIVSCHVSEGKDMFQGANRNSALITYECEEDLQKALKALHMMDNTKILVSEYIPPKKVADESVKADASKESIKTLIAPEQVPLIMEGNPVIFVFGLNLTTSKAYIKKFFADFGEVLDVDLPIEEPGLNKGYCYVRFASVRSIMDVMRKKVLRLDNKFLSVMPSVTENKWSSLPPIIEKIDLRSKSAKKTDKLKDKLAAKKEMAEAAEAARVRENEAKRAEIVARRAEAGGITQEQKDSLLKDPVVVLEPVGPNVSAKSIISAVQTFGPVRKVYLTKDRHLRNLGVAFVHFSKALHAEKLINEFCIDVEKYCVEARPLLDDEERVQAHETEQTGSETDNEAFKIYVDGLDRSVTAKEVYGHFALYGAVTNIDMPIANKRNPKKHNRGFAFVSFANQESLDAVLAVEILGGHKIKFKPVNVRLADPNRSKKRKLQQDVDDSDEPKSKKERRQRKKTSVNEAASEDDEEMGSENEQSANEDDSEGELLLSDSDEE
ncbi:polyadenylate-binding protein 8 [Hyalella azteca]|uniref:Polyadenylate-binding protein 8 n=1 Tax=Hyalella azteca TaxID=294128 RepID=A0A8B7ND89_HYAAZ|nr:polyadenylate-binding protein 8 [Hyalella azteca]